MVVWVRMQMHIEVVVQQVCNCSLHIHDDTRGGGGGG